MLLSPKFAIIFASLTCFAAVKAAPQFIDFDAILTDAAPTPTQLPVTLTVTVASATINTASAAAAASSAAVVQSENPELAATEGTLDTGSDDSTGSSDLSRRDLPQGCKAEPSVTQNQPALTNDTASAYRSFPQFAQAAEAVVPDNYNRVGGQEQYNAAIGSIGWYGYNTLKTYDVNQCASLCDAKAQCEGFNLYFERDPSTSPGNAACANTNPPSITNIKCILHGYKFNPSNFNNIGGFRGKFETAAAGSVGYLKKTSTGLAPSFPGFGLDNIVNGNCTINAPLDPLYKDVASGKYVDTFIQSAWFNSTDPANCWSTCVAHTKYTLAHDKDGNQSPCNYFTAYHIYKNGNFYQQMCGLYTRDWKDLSNPSANNTICKNTVQTRGSDTYTIAQSYDFTVLNYSQKSRTDLVPGNGTVPDRGF